MCLSSCPDASSTHLPRPPAEAPILILGILVQAFEAARAVVQAVVAAVVVEEVLDLEGIGATVRLRLRVPDGRVATTLIPIGQDRTRDLDRLPRAVTVVAQSHMHLDLDRPPDDGADDETAMMITMPTVKGVAVLVMIAIAGVAVLAAPGVRTDEQPHNNQARRRMKLGFRNWAVVFGGFYDHRTRVARGAVHGMGRPLEPWEPEELPPAREVES